MISDERLTQEVLSHSEKMPCHIAFIMDGNGRWAKKRGMARLLGHREGVRSVREMVEAGVELGVEAMTFFTFSKENWKRPKVEVSALMQLLVSTIRKEVKDLDSNNVTLRTIGCLEDLPDFPHRELEAAIEKLSHNDGLILTLAISYSGRQDIVRGVNRLLAKGVKDINEQNLAAELDTRDLPDPDLLIRTSGENRISNFLIWQLAYSELYITPTYWPDFRRRQLLEAISDYQHRERRFGCTSEQLVES
ncbi:MAG TPA: di-trans,poly-cis-decaprenylcistransferase [Bacteroidetes bacterium]|nr:di-trans,poly-cis-decaprenylcistransferase [Bacteroidota bacterium]HEX04658.1 di-trans,poly-cis-decaprenylcistransferase [Bacteroidota bacterium]